MTEVNQFKMKGGIFMKKRLGLVMAMALTAISCVSASAATIYNSSTTYFNGTVTGAYDDYEYSENTILGDSDGEIFNEEFFGSENSVHGTVTRIRERINRIF